MAASDRAASDYATPKLARVFGLVVTQVTKLAGAAVAVNESLIRSELRPAALAIAALMIAGAQGLESFLDRLFGK